MNKKLWKTNPEKTRRKEECIKKRDALERLRLILIARREHEEQRLIYTNKKGK